MRKEIVQLHGGVEDASIQLSWMWNPTALHPQPSSPHFRVFRREESEFIFGEDYEEYFHGLTWAAAPVVFDGLLTPSSDRRFSWVDSTVEVGKTYAYFVGTPQAEPIGPIALKVRDPVVWWSTQTLNERLDALARRWPDLCRVWQCGLTTLGTPIPALQIGTGEEILGLVGLIHAGESGPELIIPALEWVLEHEPELLATRSVVAIPAVNIDAREQLVRGNPWYLRKTVHGVDLNRNFPASWETVDFMYGYKSSDQDGPTYRGAFPASAPETQAVMRTFEEHHPNVVLSYHALASICGLPAVASKDGENDAEYMDSCRQVMDIVDAAFPTNVKNDGPFYFGASSGSLSTWLYQKFHIPAFDLEAGSNTDWLPALTDRTDRALLEIYQRRHANAIATVLRNQSIFRANTK